MARPNVDVLPPSSLTEALAELAYFNEEQFSVLRSSIESQDGFSTDTARLERLSASLGTSKDVVGYCLNAASYLYAKVNRNTLPSLSIVDVVNSLVDSDDGDTIDDDKRLLFKDRVVALVTKSTEIEDALKLSRLRLGFIPNAKSFKTLVDVRPNFDDEYGSVKNFVPVLQLRIRTDADDPSMKDVVVQLDERSLGQLKDAVEAAEKKIETLKRSVISAKLV